MPDPKSIFDTALLEKLSQAAQLSPFERQSLMVLLESGDPADPILKTPSIRRDVCLATFAVLATDTELTQEQLSIMVSWYKKENENINTLILGKNTLFDNAFGVLAFQGKFQLWASILNRFAKKHQLWQDALEKINEQGRQLDPQAKGLIVQALLRVSEKLHSDIKGIVESFNKEELSETPNVWAQALAVVKISMDINPPMAQIRQIVQADEDFFFHEKIHNTFVQISQCTQQIDNALGLSDSIRIFESCDWIRALLNRQALSELGVQSLDQLRPRPVM